MAGRSILLTGAMGIGKSALLREILQEYPGKCTGIFGVRILQDHKPVGYALQMGRSPEVHLIAWESLSRPVLGRYQVFTEPFQTAAAFIKRAVQERVDLFVIDELGVIEESCQEYVEAVKELLSSSLRTCLVVQQRALPFWQVLYAERRPVLFVLESNRRHEVAEQLRALLID